MLRVFVLLKMLKIREMLRMPRIACCFSPYREHFRVQQAEGTKKLKNYFFRAQIQHPQKTFFSLSPCNLASRFSTLCLVIAGSISNSLGGARIPAGLPVAVVNTLSCSLLVSFMPTRPLSCLCEGHVSTLFLPIWITPLV